MNRKILFITWDGPQVSYLQTLFLPIFKRLAEEGFDFHILQFTWGEKQRIDDSRQACVTAGFTYQAQSIWRWPRALGGLFTALYGARLIRQAVRAHGIDIVLPRSTLPALATLLALRGRSLPMVFDADGLPLDERVDFAGQSPSSLVYRVLRDIETQAVIRAEAILVRSHKAAEVLLARAGSGTGSAKFHVVINGRDSEVFSPVSERARIDVHKRLLVADTAPLVVYAGSLGPQYCPAEMLRLFELVRQQRPDAHFRILTGAPELLSPAVLQFPGLASAITVMSVPAHSIPEYLACADIGLALRRPAFSMQAVAPIKLGEYLLCGLPVIATKGIGDTDAISANQGCLLDEMDDAQLVQAAEWFINIVLPQREAFRSRCRDAGLRHFSLESSAASYQKAFIELQK